MEEKVLRRSVEILDEINVLDNTLNNLTKYFDNFVELQPNKTAIDLMMQKDSHSKSQVFEISLEAYRKVFTLVRKDIVNSKEELQNEFEQIFKNENVTS